MKFRVCVPVIAAEPETARQLLARIHDRGCLAELRLDYLRQPQVEPLLAGRRGPVLVTNRWAEEGGRWSGSEAERQRLLWQALAAGADYVDVEWRADPGWRREMLAARGASRIILSWHDFDGTPNPLRLADTFQAMRQEGADIIKIVTYAREAAECLAVLALIPAAVAAGQEIIAFCMGPAGRYSRVVAPLLGAYLTFAVLERGQESAPGQLTVSELEQLWEILA